MSVVTMKKTGKKKKKESQFTFWFTWNLRISTESHFQSGMQEKQEIIASYLKKIFWKMGVLLQFDLFLRPLTDAEYFQNKK